MIKTYTYGLTHLAINVADIERTLIFYQMVFDMEVMYKENNMLQMTTPGCKDILVFQKSSGQKFSAESGIAHFGFRLRKAGYIEKMRQKIMKAGGEIVDKGEFLPGSPFIFFKDPDGYTIEVWFESVPESEADTRPL
jgi:catechol 2,3-dioxygenase-like lactoylglutathione lyase family enzyme